jgi:formate C-acetyltransferase
MSGTPAGEPAAVSSERVRRLHERVRGAPMALCPERAVLVTRFFRKHADAREPMVVQKARALDHLLRNKKVAIHDDELLVGCFTSHRVGGGLYPELHGVAMLEDLFRFDRRRVNRLEVSPEARRLLLLEVMPYWVTRFMALRAKPFPRNLALVARQLDATAYLINETGGISHIVPDYASLVAIGTAGLRERAEERLERDGCAADARAFLRAVCIACEALEGFAAGYRAEAAARAATETDPGRREELRCIAERCGRVPRLPATTLHEALQSILFAQIALNLESLDNAVSPGRLDQILGPLYEGDIAAGRVDRKRALELLGCFAVKLCEIVPAFSERVTRFHGGLFNGQVVVVGGTDERGQDATNEVTYLLLELMDALRTRQPNYHARMHRGSPRRYRDRIARALAAGAVSPAIYNDEVIVPVLESRGVPVEHARDYATIGCVEPAPAARSFYSTDAALVNVGLCLELALSGGRGFGGHRFRGARTPEARACRSIDDVVRLLRLQVEHVVARLLDDLQAIELANARYHPTPLTSALLRGCVQSARDSTEGGAMYNASGVQGVGVVEVGDSLAALQAVVFEQRAATMQEVIAACEGDFCGAEPLRARLRAAPKYGNDEARADRFVGLAMGLFASSLGGRTNTRGGPYVAGFYSVTAHQAFGEKAGALPSGRRAGEPFSSGISPGNGRDRAGPTAVLRSAASLPLHVAKNGVNLNLKLAPWLLDGPRGHERLGWLVDGGLAAGCMQMQVNVIHPNVLLDARDNPGKYPGLLVRVSGYSAYFDDLSPEVKQEIIDRTLFESQG